MRRFVRRQAGVRRLRSSFNIPTFPGRNARTVRGFNRRPGDDRLPTLPRMRGVRLAIVTPGRSGVRNIAATASEDVSAGMRDLRGQDGLLATIISK